MLTDIKKTNGLLPLSLRKVTSEAYKKVMRWPKWKRNIKVTKYSTGFGKEEDK